MKINRRFILISAITLVSFNLIPSFALSKDKNYIVEKNKINNFSEINGWIIDHNDIDKAYCGEMHNYNCFKFVNNQYEKNILQKILNKLKLAN
jgi:hypothetical protein